MCALLYGVAIWEIRQAKSPGMVQIFYGKEMIFVGEKEEEEKEKTRRRRRRKRRRSKRGEDPVCFWSQTLTYSVLKELLQQKFLLPFHTDQPSYEAHRLYLDNVCGGGNEE